MANSDPIDPSLEELQEVVKKFNDLLQDPRPELITWKLALLRSQGQGILKLLNELGFVPDKK
jgi:hypothetical protein